MNNCPHPGAACAAEAGPPHNAAIGRKPSSRKWISGSSNCSQPGLRPPGAGTRWRGRPRWRSMNPAMPRQRVRRQAHIRVREHQQVVAAPPAPARHRHAACPTSPRGKRQARRSLRSRGSPICRPGSRPCRRWTRHPAPAPRTPRPSLRQHGRRRPRRSSLSSSRAGISTDTAAGCDAGRNRQGYAVETQVHADASARTARPRAAGPSMPAITSRLRGWDRTAGRRPPRPEPRRQTSRRLPPTPVDTRAAAA